MELELRSPVVLAPETFTVLIAPGGVLATSLNDLPGLRRIEALYVCGNRFRILDDLDRRFTSLDVRRGFTAHQLLSILKEAYQTLIVFENDPGIFEGASEMAEYVGRALKEASASSAVLLYSPGTDPRPSERRLKEGCKGHQAGPEGPEDPGGVLMGRTYRSVRMGVP